MTVDELIEHLKTLPPEQRSLEFRVWLPGSHIAVDSEPFRLQPGTLNKLPVVAVEGNVVEGSALDTMRNIALSR
jgi:hypothetical protein